MGGPSSKSSRAIAGGESSATQPRRPPHKPSPSRCSAPAPSLYLRPPPPSPPLPRRRSPATKPPPLAAPSVRCRRRPGRKGGQPGREVPLFPSLPLEPSGTFPDAARFLRVVSPGITAAAAEPARRTPAMQVVPHGGRGALPSAGGSPSDLLFLAGGGLLL